MKKYIICMLCCLTLSRYGGGQTGGENQREILVRLWTKTVKPYLSDNLWEESLQYDAGHALMLPLHGAFLLKDKKMLDQFQDQFVRFMQNDQQILGTVHPDKQLSRLHYLYLASEYVALCRRQPALGAKDIVDALQARIRREVLSFYKETTYKWYDGATFSGGIREQLAYKLDAVKRVRLGLTSWPEYRFYLGISDVDLFTLAMLANVGTQDEKNEAVKLAREIFTTYGDFSNQGYTFQKGFWAQHPDYIYAGNNELKPGLKKIIVDDLAEDSSHSHRIPLFLHAFKHASSQTVDREFFEMVLAALSKTFYEKVAVDLTVGGVKTVLLTNFMDGRNGVYRYNYSSVGSNLGYGPFALSGILIEGWWGFLQGTHSVDRWKTLQSNFPLNDTLIAFYVGPNTTRVRHPLVKWPEFFSNGFGELNTRFSLLIQQNGGKK